MPIESSEDIHLMKLLETDAERAIEFIYKTYHAALARTAYRLVGDSEVARDLVQDVFIKFWNGRNNLRLQTSLRAYLHRSVINASLTYLQKEKKNSFLSPEVCAGSVNDTVTGEDSIAIQELSLAIDQAILHLPIRCRTVFCLNRFEEMSYREIAASLGISTKAVEKEMMKALQSLRLRLKNYLPLLLLWQMI